MYQKTSEALFDFINNSTDPYHAIDEVSKELLNKGFRKLCLQDSWQLQPGDRCFIDDEGGSLIAFVVGKKRGFRVIATHSDSPSFVLKKNIFIKDNPAKLNCAPYGGMILSSWLDRPLGISGRVIVKNKRLFHPSIKLVKSSKPTCIIPNLCLHFNGKLNDGHVYRADKDMVPLLPFEDGKQMMDQLLDQVGVLSKDVLASDLRLFPFGQPQLIGSGQQAFLSAPRLDNLAMLHASLSAFLAIEECLQESAILYIANHEEVGSLSRSGMNSATLKNVLMQIDGSLKAKVNDFSQALAHSFCISADQAHAHHPNYAEYEDALHAPQINAGPVIKHSVSKSYATEDLTAGIFQALCCKESINCQDFYTRSDMRGGATLGPIISRHLPMRIVDVGNPMLAMHSAWELAGLKDQVDMCSVMKAFYIYEESL